MSTGLTGLTGTDGPQGCFGPTGPVGPVGLVGWGDGSVPGNTGPTGVGQPGSPNFNISNITGTSITLTTASLGTTYYTTNNAFASIALPASMPGITAGAFWMFQNNSSAGLTIALTNGTSTYNGSTSATSITLPVGNGFTLVYSGSGTGYIVF